MDFKNLYIDLENRKDADQAKQMSAYMRDQFQFLGIPTPMRKVLCQKYFKAAKAEEAIDWAFVDSCWLQPYREFQYIGMEYLLLMQKYLTPLDIPKIKELIITKSWWDTVDGLDKVIGDLALTNPEVNEIILKWSADDNIWLRRVAIDHQLQRKDKTDVELMEKIIINNLGQSEFFINKAIGWSLRDYSKTNPAWVSNFIERYRDKLAPLSIKEASKYI